MISAKEERRELGSGALLENSSGGGGSLTDLSPTKAWHINTDTSNKNDSSLRTQTWKDSQIEFPAKLLNYVLWSDRSNINQIKFYVSRDKLKFDWRRDTHFNIAMQHIWYVAET